MGKKKINTEKLGKNLIRTYNLIDYSKNICKVCIINAMHADNINTMRKSMLSCSETIEVLSLTEYMLASQSTYRKSVISLAIKVLKKCIKICNKQNSNVSKTCAKTNTDLIKSLKELKTLI